MKVYVLDKMLEYEDNRNSFDKMVSDIVDLINDSELILSHLIIDGIDVYDDYQNYFLDNMNNIEEIIVVTKSVKKISQDVLLSAIDYIKGAVPEIEILADEFYKEPSDESWNKLNDLLEGIQWIMDTFVAIDTNDQIKDIVNSYEEWNLYAKDIYSLQELIKEFEEILENSDFVSIADILSYEIIPLFKEMEEKLNNLLLEEVVADDVDR